MFNILDYPLVFCLASFVVLAVAARIGALFYRTKPMPEDLRETFDVVKTATLTLLGLIIGFTFSMAVSRYDQRKNLEEAEANAIGTEYVRVDLLPAAEAAKARALLRSYLDLRIQFYSIRDGQHLLQVDAQTTKLQAELWNAIVAPVTAQPNPVNALVAAGMNDVLNSQGYAQAAWWNRIPVAAWGMMLAIAVCSNILLGVGASNRRAETFLLLILPAVFSIAFVLIADIDSPRGGLIHVVPQNLHSLVQSLR